MTDSVATPSLAGFLVFVGRENGFDQEMGQLLGVFDRDRELPLAQAGLVDQLDDRAVVGVAAGDQDVADTGFVGDFAADDLHHGFGGPAADIDADECDLVVARGDHDRLGHQGVERAFGGHVVARTIAPHGNARGRRDVLVGGADLKVGAGSGALRLRANISSARARRPKSTATMNHGADPCTVRIITRTGDGVSTIIDSSTSGRGRRRWLA